jgi:adenosine deaminase
MKDCVVSDVPKAELHCHLDGVVDPAMLRGLSGPREDFTALAAELALTYPVTSLEHWQREYQPVLARFLQPPALRLPQIALAQVERWSFQNVRHGELFVSTILGQIADDGALCTWFRALGAAIEALPQPPRVKFVLCLSRNKLIQNLPRLLRLARAGVIAGVSLAGDELACSIRELAGPLADLRAQGLGIEIHAGEQGGPDSVWDALEHGHPCRIGHGVRAFEDPALVARLAESGVHLEFCPTSNLSLGVIRAIDELPLPQALAAGIPFSINSDDPGVFGCSLSSELDLVTRTFGLELPQLMQIYDNACLAAF